MVFAGTATVDTDPFPLSDDDQEAYSHENSWYRAPYGVRLSEIRTWDEPKPARPLVQSLSYVNNPAHWGVYLQGGVLSLSAEDYLRITSAT